jgi:hypothetical protein
MTRAAPRLTAFRLGLLAGVLTPFAIWLVAHLAVASWLPAERPPRFNVLALANGADVSRHGGVRVVVSNEHATLTQTCSGPCDDLRYEADSGDNVYRLSAYDAAGRCIACDEGQYVSGGYGAGLTRFTLSGAERLTVNHSFDKAAR